jgi:hypothetical protein
MPLVEVIELAIVTVYRVERGKGLIGEKERAPE